MKNILEYQEGLQYSEEVRDAVLFGYIYRKESESLDNIKVHFCIDNVPEIFLWFAEIIVGGLVYDVVKSLSKKLFRRIKKKGLVIDASGASILKDSKEFELFYTYVKEFNEKRMAVNEEQYKYIREEIEADVIGRELGKIYSEERREPTVQEIMEFKKKAIKKADNLLGTREF